MKETLRGATLQDASALAPLLRACDVAEIKAASGKDPHTALADAVLSSEWSITVADAAGAPVLMAGVAPWGSTAGAPWMLASQALPKHHRFLARTTPAVVRRMSETFPVLYNYVDLRNTHSTLWLMKIGFEITGIEPEYGIERLPFLRFSRVSNV